ncbi:hypothetical protein RFI_25518, partial [Reticulomyxa filosa]
MNEGGTQQKLFIRLKKITNVIFLMIFIFKKLGTGRGKKNSIFFLLFLKQMNKSNSFETFFSFWIELFYLLVSKYLEYPNESIPLPQVLKKKKKFILLAKKTSPTTWLTLALLCGKIQSLFLNPIAMNENDMKVEEVTNAPMDIVFETLTSWSIPSEKTQCILFKDEIIICGGHKTSGCYSYHILKNKYKFICRYPSDVVLEGHCVVRLEHTKDDINEMTLLSFGGSHKHALIMKYVSVWNNDKTNSKAKHWNKWVPLADNNNNNAVSIGTDEDDYLGARALIGGSNNNLLFITYYPKNIAVFNLNTFQLIKYETLPVRNCVFFHCFVKAFESNTNANNKNTNMLLFCFGAGLSIEYNEDYNLFHFHKIQVWKPIRAYYSYACVRIQDSILFFGGKNFLREIVHEIYVYSISGNKWMKHRPTLPIPLRYPVTVLSEDKKWVYIFGVFKDMSAAIRTEARKWKDYEKDQQWMIEDKQLTDIGDIAEQLADMKSLSISNLK